MCRIWDEDFRDRVAYYRSMGPMKNKKNGPQNQGKPYPTPPKQHGNRPNNQRTAATRYGKSGRISSNCGNKDMTCFNYRQKMHI
ncbi:hypothetical protein GmHk_11G032030 [Glycine max]|nr:hypothetical protein GmHk_11G032030 [Glycine max]